MKWSIYLGKISGIKVFIHWTLIFFLVWIGINSWRNGASAKEMYYSLLFMASDDIPINMGSNKTFSVVPLLSVTYILVTLTDLDEPK